MPWLLVLAYTCSGLAGLIYEVGWTRLLTLHIGHSTAAASAVVAAFLGGLAGGAGLGGIAAARLTPRQGLQAYLVLEVAVIVSALVLPWELAGLTPLLAWAYNDGAPGLLFPAIRLLSCFAMVLVPALALGATYPMAIRWCASDTAHPARSSSLLYAANTAGAAAGALLAGFVLIPKLGLTSTVYVGMAATGAAGLCAASMLFIGSRRGRSAPLATAAAATERASRGQARTKPRQKPQAHEPSPLSPADERRWIAIVAVTLSGFAALAHEIVWTRLVSLLLGPTIYAFAATLAAVIAGVAAGSAAGTALVSRVRRPALWLAAALAAAALVTSGISSLAGGWIPRFAAQQIAASQATFDASLWRGVLLTAALIVPTASCLGAVFPLALAVASDPTRSAAGRSGNVYAVNTAGAVLGSLAAGFVLIPWLGLQRTLAIVTACLVLAAVAVALGGALSARARGATMLAAAAAAAIAVMGPAWDRDLLASGPYLYARFVPKDLDLERLLKAGTLLYYREGAAATVSVKRLTGTTTLAVDGKVDASNRSDMLTQKLIAHLPLLMHDRPRDVGIIGLGSGVTLGAALRHPISRADVIEISPEVIEASRYFVDENRHALDDPRTHLIVGDGRSHLLLSKRKYDVIVSEPSNPWIAGVSALFTREFFVTARDHLSPGGVMCQWANAYNISDTDLRAIVATFASVFPDATVWLVGGDDVLLVGSADAGMAGGSSASAVNEIVDARLERIARNWTRPGVAEDLATVSVLEPFSLLSLFAAGPSDVARYGADATLLDDDRMSLEFSTPRELHRRNAGDNTSALTALADPAAAPAIVRQALSSATAVEWRHRAAMMAKSDAQAAAYDGYLRALTLDPDDAVSLNGLVHTAIQAQRSADALAWIRGLMASRGRSPAALVATSKLLMSTGATAEAIDAADEARRIASDPRPPLEQLASIFADTADLARLDAAVADLAKAAPGSAPAHYYAAVSALLHGRPDETVTLAERAVAADPGFAPVYDLLGAAQTKLDRPDAARRAFEASLGFDAHDSTAYTNLGLLELAAGNHGAASRYFAEALWLAPASTTARQGLARATGR